MVKLSIVIPYYKTYELTEKLLRELHTQIKTNVEVILIDDGCFENEFDALKYNLHFHNLKIIHKENGGVSSARNIGLKETTGEYIAFIDSDDMIMPNYIETLLELIKEHEEEIIYFNWLDINTNEVIRHPSNPAVWKAIYKKEILPLFDENLKAKEDYFFLEEINKKEHTEYYYDKILYIYNSGRLDGLTCKNERGEL